MAAATTVPAASAATPAAAAPAEAVALYEYVTLLTSFPGTEANDLSVQAGDHIYLLESVSDDWWRARTLDGTRTGIVPSTYVNAL